MKKRIAVMLAVLMLIPSVVVLGEENYVDLKARDLELNAYCEVLACRFDGSDAYCLIRPDGTKITDEIYSSIRSISSYPYYRVEVKSADGVHDEGIIDEEGSVLIPAEYADVSVVSDRWAYGIRLTPSSADDKDYTFTNWNTGDKSFYRIDTVHFYYRGTLAGTLNRTDFDGYPSAYGDYLCVTARDKTRVYYNSRMEKSPYQPEYSGEYSSYYKNRATHYTHNGTGQAAFEPGCTLTEEEVSRSIVYENGKFLNLQGEEAFKAAQNYDYVQEFRGGYAVVRMNQLCGLIDATGREVIPPEYEEVGNYEDHPLKYGVIQAVKDGKFGYLDGNGNVTCRFVYAKDIVRSYGPLATIKNLDGTIIVLSGVAGELPEHYAEVEMRTNSCVFEAKNEAGERCLINLKGETLIPYTDTNYITFNLEGTVAFCNMGSRNYRIYHYPGNQRELTEEADGTGESVGETAQEQTETQPAGDGSWTCSNGHEGNTGNFCPVCGEQRPAQEIICPVCGAHYAAGEVPNFCPEDGTKLK